VGEFLILLGAWKANPVLTAVAGTGVVFGAVYMLWMFQRVMFGPIKHKENEELKDLTGREILVLVPLIAAIFVMGVFPNFFLEKMEPSIQRFISKSTAGLTSPKEPLSAVALNEKGKSGTLMAKAKANAKKRIF